MNNAKIQLIVSMLIFGSIGLFVRSIPAAPSQIALVRGLVGSTFLFVIGVLIKRRVSWARIRPNLGLLIASGAALGFNWILLFQAYHLTTISNATIGYYFAPVIVMFLSPWVLKEKLTVVKVLCILAAMAGMFCIVGISAGPAGTAHLLGFAYALAAACLYAAIVLLNKFLKNISGIESSLMQLGISAAALLPYVLLTEGRILGDLAPQSILLLLVVGVVHTGIVYFMYFSVIQKLSGQTVAAFSYIDPVSAILMSSLILHENLSLLQVFGGVLILGATFVNEMFAARRGGKAEALVNEQPLRSYGILG